MSNIKLKDMVEKVLQDYPETRNSDSLLWLITCWKLFPEHFLQMETDGPTFTSWNAIANVFPLESTTGRMRAKFQNKEGKYLPTDQEILEYRQRSKKDIDSLKEWEKRFE